MPDIPGPDIYPVILLYQIPYKKHADFKYKTEFFPTFTIFCPVKPCILPAGIEGRQVRENGGTDSPQPKNTRHGVY